MNEPIGEAEMSVGLGLLVVLAYVEIDDGRAFVEILVEVGEAGKPRAEPDSALDLAQLIRGERRRIEHGKSRRGVAACHRPRRRWSIRGCGRCRCGGR